MIQMKSPYRPAWVPAQRLGQREGSLTCDLSLSGKAIGGTLLVAGSALSALLSKEHRPVAMVGRLAAGVFGAYLVLDEACRTASPERVPRPVVEDVVLPMLLYSAAVAALVGGGYLLLKP